MISEEDNLSPVVLFEKIRHCRGTGNCYGKITNQENGKPVCFCQQSGRRAKVVVITEQPGPTRSGVNLEQKMASREFKKAEVPYRVNEVLGDRFYTEFERRIYWTHYIKCPGTIRGKKKPRGTIAEDDCAKRWLQEEIEVHNPELVITVGARASRFVLGRIGEGLEWKEVLWNELCSSALGERCHPPIFKDAEVFVLPHPSKASPLGYFVDTKLRPVIAVLMDEVLGSQSKEE